MSRVRKTHPVDLRPLIDATLPRNAAKELARAEGCSLGTAKRIIATGEAPMSRALRVLAWLEHLAVQRVEHIERLRAEAREKLDEAGNAPPRGSRTTSPLGGVGCASSGGSRTHAPRAQTA